MDELGKLLQSIATLLWPLLFALVFYGFRDTIKAI